MIWLIAFAGAAVFVEVLAFVLVVHTLLRHAMLARGLPAWRLGDTVLTSPLLWIGAAMVAGALNRGLAVAGLRAGLGGEISGDATAAATIGLAGLGLVVGWFGLRAVGKLY